MTTFGTPRVLENMYSLVCRYEGFSSLKQLRWQSRPQLRFEVLFPIVAMSRFHSGPTSWSSWSTRTFTPRLWAAISLSTNHGTVSEKKAIRIVAPLLVPSMALA